MTDTLRHVDPHQPASRLARLWARLALTRPARFLSRHVGWRLDPLLLRATRGRVATTILFPAAVLETRGAKTGAVRRHAVIYFHDGDAVTIVASQAGAATHPAWFHNLRAHPEVMLGDVPMTASVVDDDAELARLWRLAGQVFPGFTRYRAEAARHGRTIPIIQLRARPATA